MKKITRAVALFLVAIMCAGILGGCSVFVRNEKRYLAQTALKVGGEAADLREILEFFSQYAQTYMSSYGYSAQEVWDLIMPSFVAQLAAIDLYKKNFKAENYNNSDLAKKYENGKYLSDEVILYYQGTVALEILKTLDSQLETLLTESGGYTFDAAEEVTERAELEVFDITSVAKYKAAYDYDALDKELSVFLDQGNVFPSVNYVYTIEKVENVYSPTAAQKDLIDAAMKLLNDRLSEPEDGEKEQEPIDYETYVRFQNKAINLVNRTLKENSYDNAEDYANARMRTLLRQAVYQNYKLNEDVKIESDFETLFAQLDARMNNFVYQTIENYSKNPASFESFITSLSATSYIYYIPEQYVGAYGFVKNLLVPFTEEQSTQIKFLKGLYGDGTPEYFAARDKLAFEIEGVYFGDSESEYYETYKDLLTYDEEDEEYKFNLFKKVGDDYVVTELLTDKFSAIQSMTTVAEKKRAFIDLMFMYNTDVGQHNSAYDYVIKKKKSDITGTADAWVTEFALCARNLANKEGEFVVGGVDVGFAIPYGTKGQTGAIDYCVTDYGVHFIFYSGDVTADFDITVNQNGTVDMDIDWNNIYGSHIGAGSAEYRFFNTYYDAVVAALYSKTLDEITAQYIDNYNYYQKVLKEFFNTYDIKLK